MEFSPIPPNFESALDTTRELRDFYVAQVAEYERRLEYARSQLFHAEALLSGLSKLQPPTRASESVAAMSMTNGNGHKAANGHSQKQLSKEQDFASGNGVQLLQEPLLAVQDSASLAESYSDSDVQLLPPYQDLSLSDAIALLLEDNAGTILKLDFIVRSLYGKLSAPQVVTVTQKVKRSLEAGVEEGRWQRDALNHPDNLDCYTWGLPVQAELTQSVLSDSFDNNDIDEESVALPIVDGVVSENELLDLVEKGLLNFDKMKRIAQKFQFRSYGTIKSPEVFAAFLGRKSIKRSVIQRFLQ